MAVDNNSNRATEIDDEDDNDDEEEEEIIKNLEVEVKQMAESILHYRETVPNQLKQTFASLLLAQRPPPVVTSETALPGALVAAAAAAGATNPDMADDPKSRKVALLGEEDPETAEKIRLLKHNIASNVSVMPVVLKRMNDCISMIDKLDTDYANIPPAFKRKRPY